MANFSQATSEPGPILKFVSLVMCFLGIVIIEVCGSSSNIVASCIYYMRTSLHLVLSVHFCALILMVMLMITVFDSDNNLMNTLLLFVGAALNIVLAVMSIMDANADTLVKVRPRGTAITLILTTLIAGCCMLADGIITMRKS